MQLLGKCWLPSVPLLISGIMRKAVKCIKYICLVQQRLIETFIQRQTTHDEKCSQLC